MKSEIDKYHTISLKHEIQNMTQVNLSMKEKQDHGCGEQIHGRQAGRGLGET